MNWGNTDMTRTEIRERLREIQSQINTITALYNLTDDPQLVESYIYELKALNIRYNHYIHQLKEGNIA